MTVFPFLMRQQAVRRPDIVIPPVVQPDLVLTAAGIQFTDAQTSHGFGTGLATTGMLWTPRMPNRNGKTFLLWSNDAATNPYGQVRILPFDNQIGFDIPQNIGNVLSGLDGHYVPSGDIVPDPSDDLDRLEIIQENLHDTPLDRYKSRVSLDASKFSQLTDIGTELSYANICKKANGNRFIWSRGIQFDWDIYVTEATDMFETWGAQLRVSQAPSPELDTLRHYPGVPFGYQRANGFNEFLIIYRNDTNEAYHRVYWVRSDDTLRTFSNVFGSWSRHIVNDGILTDDLLNTNAKVCESVNNTTNGGYPCAGMSADGLRAFIVRGADGTLANSRVFYHRDGWPAWIEKPLGIANLEAGPIFSVGHYLMIFSEINIQCVFHINNGTEIKACLFQSTDLFDTWTNILDFAPEIEANTAVSVPNEMMQIAHNENFAVVVSEDIGSAQTILHCKMGAWGAIQAVPGLSVTPAVSMNYNSTGLFHYKCVDASITRSGNNVTGLTDLFGIRNATGVNNPQWNGSNGIAFVAASSQSFTVGTPASLVDKNALHFMCVGTFSAATIFIISFAQNTATNKYIGFRVESTGQITHHLNNVTAALITGQDTVIDGNKHLVELWNDGRGGQFLAVDGKMQHFSANIAAGSALWNSMGKGPSTISGLNTVNIARADLSGTDGHYSFSFNEMVLWSDVLPEVEARARRKKLCDDYGITYQHQFQVPA